MLDLIGKAKAISSTDLGGLSPISGTSDINTVVARLINVVLWAAGVVAIIYLIYSGIMYITAGGDSDKATKGKTGVVNAIIGIIIILLALVIVSWVSTLVTSGV